MSYWNSPADKITAFVFAVVLLVILISCICVIHFVRRCCLKANGNEAIAVQKRNRRSPLSIGSLRQQSVDLDPKTNRKNNAIQMAKSTNPLHITIPLRSSNNLIPTSCYITFKINDPLPESPTKPSFPHPTPEHSSIELASTPTRPKRGEQV